MATIIKAHGISEKVLGSAVDCINRLAVTHKTTVDKIEVIDRYSSSNMATWQVMYTFSDGRFFTLLVNRKAIY